MGIDSVRTQPQTLYGLIQDLKSSGANDGKFLRAEKNGTEIFTSSKLGGGFMNLLAKAGIGFAEQRQSQEREAGVTKLKSMIDNEYGKGVGDLVFKQLNNINEGATLKNPEGRDFNKGVTLKDLERVKVFAERYREHKPAEKVSLPVLPKTDEQKIADLENEIANIE